MDGIPNGVEVRYFIGEKFNDVKSGGDSQHPRMGERLQRRGKVNDAEALEKP